MLNDEKLNELVFINETLKKNLEEFHKLGDFSKVVDNLKKLDDVSTTTLRASIDEIDWSSVVRKATSQAESEFLKQNNNLIEIIKSFEKTQKRAEDSVKVVDTKVLHEIADNSINILENQKKVKRNSVFFMGLLMFFINFGIVVGGLSYFGLISNPQGQQNKIIDMFSKMDLTLHEIDNNSYYIEFNRSLVHGVYDMDGNPSKKLFEITK